MCLCVCLCVWCSDASKGLDRIWLITCSRKACVCVCVCVFVCVVQQRIKGMRQNMADHLQQRQVGCVCVCVCVCVCGTATHQRDETEYG